MKNTKKNLLISFATQYADLIIQFVNVLLLARLMSPKEIGTYSVASFLMSILHVFRDFGVARYIIQEPDLTREKIRSAYGVAIILAFSVALILLASSGFVADFYHTPEIRNILLIMAGSFAITPIGSLLTSIFRREMQFKKIFIVLISSALSQVVVGITLAYHGFGAVSLGWANFAGILGFGIAANLLRSRDIPWTPSFKNIKTILSFGSIASTGSVASVAGANAPDVIIGKAIGLAAAGYYSRANGLLTLFNRLVTGTAMPIIMPYFAQIRREKGNLTEPYHLATEHLTVFAWPFFTVMSLLAFPIVRTLYGDQWDASVPVTQILCIGAAISSLGIFAGEVMVANGHIRQVTKAQLLMSATRVIALLIGSAYSLISIAFAVAISECISLFVISRVLYATTGIKFTEVLRATGKSAVITILSAAVPAFTMMFWPPHDAHTWAPLAIGLPGAFAGWIIGIVLTDHAMKPHLGRIYRFATKQ
jgi:O-antigen/teichoic acid export membrane protein